MIEISLSNLLFHFSTIIFAILIFGLSFLIQAVLRFGEDVSGWYFIGPAVLATIYLLWRYQVIVFN